MKFTKGPWKWFCNDKQKQVYLATEDRGRLYVMGFERYGLQGAAPSFRYADGMGFEIIKRVDEFNEPDHNGNFNINHPDAHLIAAAPELYEALDELSDRMAFILNHMDVKGYYQNFLVATEKSRAALAKARGES